MSKTTIAIPKQRRKEIKDQVRAVLSHSGEVSLPVKIKAIAKSWHNVRLVSYSRLMRDIRLNYNEVLLYLKTKDACTDYEPDLGQYVIYYNNIDPDIVRSNRFRWNIAHELGHAVLNHLKDNECLRLFRSQLTDDEYDYLEAEADYFAALLLVPHVPLARYKVSQKLIMDLCKISKPAASRRYKEYIHWKRNLSAKDEYDGFIFKYYYTFMYKHKCKYCDAHVIQRYGDFCPICGNKSLQWGDGNMKYEKLETHKNNKLKLCPICKNEETDIEGDFCQICSVQLINRCDNRGGDQCYEDTPCGQVLDSNARYCPKCGTRSTFFNDDILKAWNHYSLGDGMMKIPDGVEEDGLPFN